MKKLLLLSLVILFYSCTGPDSTTEVAVSTQEANDYLDYTGRDDLLSGGVKLIPIQTASGEFNVWTKRVGNNADIKVLLLHGGPGATHEYYEVFDSFMPQAGIEYYYYDQLESAYSDQPNDSSLWTIDRYVEEVEQVRKALGLDKNNFFLLGNSWGGMLAIEYALKYQENLKGLIICNMMSSVPEYNKYAEEVLGPQMPAEVLEEVMALEEAGDYGNPRYSELLFEHYYTEHVLRFPLEEWPDPVNRAFAKLNPNLYVTMQGPSEFGIKGNARLKDWDRSGDLGDITVPTLVIGAEYDTMDPKHMEWMSTQIPNGEYLYCPNGSHMALYDDAYTFFPGLISFLNSVN